MPIISCEITYAGKITGNTFVTQADFNASLKETWSEVGRYFLRTFVPKHFTKPGANEYRSENVAYGEVAADDTYRARSGEGESGKQFWASYNGRKQKEGRGQLDLVFSGNTREGAKQESIEATRYGVVIHLPGCVHLNQYKPKPKKYGPHAGEPPLNLRGDLLAISRREVEEVRGLHERIMAWKFGREFLQHHVVTIN
jgi:hypothetical protein